MLAEALNFRNRLTLPDPIKPKWKRESERFIVGQKIKGGDSLCLSTGTSNMDTCLWGLVKVEHISVIKLCWKSHITMSLCALPCHFWVFQFQYTQATIYLMIHIKLVIYFSSFHSSGDVCCTYHYTNPMVSNFILRDSWSCRIHVHN